MQGIPFARKDIPASVRICDRIGASGRIPVKHLANSNGSRYKTLLAFLKLLKFFRAFSILPDLDGFFSGLMNLYEA